MSCNNKKINIINISLLDTSAKSALSTEEENRSCSGQCHNCSKTKQKK